MHRINPRKTKTPHAKLAHDEGSKSDFGGRFIKLTYQARRSKFWMFMTAWLLVIR